MTSAKDITKPEENKTIKVKVEFEFWGKKDIKVLRTALLDWNYGSPRIDDLIKILEKYAE